MEHKSELKEDLNTVDSFERNFTEGINKTDLGLICSTEKGSEPSRFKQNGSQAGKSSSVTDSERDTRKF